MSDYSDAFKEVFDAVQPDSDPVISYGDGETPDVEKELDRIIERCKTATWEASTEEEPVTVRYGEKRLPTSGNGHIYKAVQGGVTGSTEPAWGLTNYSQVTDGTIIWEEAGYFVGSVYDTDSAKYAALDVKVQKAVSKDQYLQDGRGTASTFLYLNCQRERDKYKPVGIA